LDILIGHLKGARARLINAELSPEPPFAWEEGYGLFTVGPRQLSTAVSYVRSQKQHHAQNATNAAQERTSDD
jgi:putative transposase